MKKFLPILFFSCLAFFTCKDDDIDASAPCVAPDNPEELPLCFLDEIDAIRPTGMDSVTYKVNLYLRDGEPFYALLPSDIRGLISVYNACCELDCQQGFPPPEDLCDWLGDADDLGIIYEE